MLAGLVGCAAQPGPEGPTRWEDEAVQQQAAALRAAPERVTEAALLARIGRLLCGLDREACNAIEVVVLDRPGLRCELVGGRLLRIHLPLLQALPDDDALAFVLGHEVAHRRLGHVAARRRFGWDPVAAEIAADAEARHLIVAAGHRDAALATLQALRTRGAFVDATLDARIDALAATVTP